MRAVAVLVVGLGFGLNGCMCDKQDPPPVEVIGEEPAQNPSVGPEEESDGVLLHSGQLRREWTDLAFGERESGLTLTRTYRANEAGDGLLGPGWYLSAGRRIDRDGDTLIWRDETGLAHRFEGGLAPPGVYAVATTGGDGTTTIALDGAQDLYDAAGRLVGWTDELGRATTVFLQNGRPVLLERWDGETITLAYDDDGRLTRATAGTMTRDYRYDPAGRLEAVLLPAAPVWDAAARTLAPAAVTGETYAYDSAGLLARITDGTGAVTLENDYDADARVIAQRWGGGETRYEYLDGATTRVTGRLGWRWEYVHDAGGHAIETRQFVADTTRITTRAYDTNGELVLERSPLGNEQRWVYDEAAADARDRGNVLDEDGVVWTYTRHQQPRSSTSRGGNVTTWRYESDEVDGGADLNGDGRVGPDRPLPILITPPEVTNWDGLPEAIPTTMRYDDDGLLAVRIAPDGTRTTWEHVAGLPVRMVLDAGDDPHPRTGEPRRNRETLWMYDADRRETRVVEPDMTLETEYDARGLIAVYRFGPGDEARQGYDAAGHVALRETDRLTADGAPDPALPVQREWFEYDERGALVRLHREIAAGEFLTSRLDRDLVGHLIRLERGNDIFSVEYQAIREPVAVRAPSGELVTVIRHDLDGRRIGTATGDGAEATDAYDDEGRVTTHVALDGQRTETTYDADGGESGQAIYSPKGVLIAETRWVTDARGRLIEQEDEHFDGTTGAPIGDGVITRRWVYDEGDTIRDLVGEDGVATSFVADGAGAPVSILFPDGGDVAFEHDDGGAATATIFSEPDAELGETRTERVEATYDDAGRLLTRTDAEGRTWSFDHGSAGLERALDPAGNLSSWEHDGFDRIAAYTQTPDATSTTTVTKAYDAAGIIALRADDNGNETSWERNELGQAVAIVSPGGARSEYFYGPNGKLVEAIDANGTTTTFEVDGGGRVESRVIDPGPGVIAPPMELYLRDAAGRITAATAGDVTFTRRYDSAGRLLEETQPAGTFRYTHDDVGRLVGLTYPNGLEVTYERDAAGRVVTVRTPTETLATYTYTGTGRVRERTILGRFVTRYSYLDEAYTGLPTRITHLADGVTVADHFLDRDLLGNILGEVRAEDGFDEDLFAYDRMQRLIDVQLANGLGIAYTLDGAHNRVNRRLSFGPGEFQDFPATIGPRNQLLAGGFATYAYDENGNRTGDNGTLLAYDHRNRLVSIDPPDVREATFENDADGRPVGFTVVRGSGLMTTGTIGWGGSQLRVTDGSEPDCPDDPRDEPPPTIYGEEIDGTCEIDLPLSFGGGSGMGVGEIRDVVWGGAPGENLPLFITGNDGRWIVMENAQGSPSAVISEGEGTIERYRYTPDGGRSLDVDEGSGRVFTDIDDAPSRLPIGYAGYVQLESWTYAHAPARDYDPATGVWLQPDPIGDWGDATNLGNTYAYVKGSPINGRDPTGLFYSVDYLPFVRMDDHTPTSERHLVGRMAPEVVECINRANRNTDDQDDHHVYGGVPHPRGHFLANEYHGQPPDRLAKNTAGGVSLYNTYVNRVIAEINAYAREHLKSRKPGTCSYVTLLYGELLHAAQDVNSHRGMSNRDHKKYDPDGRSGPSFPDRLRRAGVATGQLVSELEVVHDYFRAFRAKCVCCENDDVSPARSQAVFLGDDTIFIDEAENRYKFPRTWPTGQPRFMIGPNPGGWVEGQERASYPVPRDRRGRR